ncbi:hypothetical protein KAR91_08190 [Candidatus Pacearchaeota archaeon]|nr:hypothetical protein [Candidatus Pacearchaeota archaeon]
MEAVLPGMFGGFIAAIITVFVMLRLGNKQRKQQYYMAWISQITQHNWQFIHNDKLKTGLLISPRTSKEVRILCYQHLNLLLLAWLHKGIINKDHSINGWKRWCNEMLKGAEVEGNREFAEAYSDILSSGDMYPDKFLLWLKSEMGLSPSSFKKTEAVNRN